MSYQPKVTRIKYEYNPEFNVVELINQNGKFIIPICVDMYYNDEYLNE